MYKVIELKGGEITNYQGTIVSVLRHQYCYGMWYLTCLVQEQEEPEKEPSAEEKSLNEKFEKFKVIVKECLKQYNIISNDSARLIFDKKGNIMGCGFCYKGYSFILTSSYDLDYWKIVNSSRFIVSLGETCNECIELFAQKEALFTDGKEK